MNIYSEDIFDSLCQEPKIKEIDKKKLSFLENEIAMTSEKALDTSKLNAMEVGSIEAKVSGYVDILKGIISDMENSLNAMKLKVKAEIATEISPEEENKPKETKKEEPEETEEEEEEEEVEV